MIQRSCRRPGAALFLVVALTANVASGFDWYVDVDATSPSIDTVCNEDGSTRCTSANGCAGALNKCVLLARPASWCNALTDLQIAIDSAGLFDTIKVANGTYFPDPTGLADPRNATFRLPSTAMTIEGGYAGCGAAIEDERDFVAFESILSGDLLGNDDPNAPSGAGGTCCQSPHAAGCDDATCQTAVCDANPSCCSSLWNSGCRNLARSLCCNLCGDNVTRCDNSLHVVTGNGTDDSSVLDGFSITAGNANGSSTPDDVGGGMLNDRGSPKVRNCIFRSNTANRGGGGVYNKGELIAPSTPRFFNCIIETNVASQSGGGVRNIDSDSTFTNCLFTGNRSENNLGGAMSSENSNPVFANCTIVDNFALGGGGGIFFGGSVASVATVFNSIVWGNSDNSLLPLERQQLGVFGSSGLILGFSCVQGCDTDLGGFCEDPTDKNIGDDPRFVPGPIGCYYLSDTAVGEPFDSACIDSGGLPADGVSLGNGTTLADRTTQSGEVLDTGFVDMGHHYPDTAAPVDPDTGLKFLLGDQDRDGVVDLFDYDEFVACLSNPDTGEVTPCCRIFDYELDGDVDLQDFAEFQMSFFPP